MPDDRELAVGDKVKGKLGEVMIVEGVYPANYPYRYTCSWISADGAKRHDLFSRDQLVVIGIESWLSRTFDETACQGSILRLNSSVARISAGCRHACKG